MPNMANMTPAPTSGHLPKQLAILGILTTLFDINDLAGGRGGTDLCYNVACSAVQHGQWCRLPMTDTTFDTTPRTPLERELNTALHETLDEIEALKAENGRLQGRLDALMTAFDANGALGVLQRIMHDSDLRPELRVKAAGLAVGYERAKPASEANVRFSLFNYLEGHRLAELDQKAKTIEARPLQRDQGIMGHDGGPEPAA
jgi:hypothetical protein